MVADTRTPPRSCCVRDFPPPTDATSDADAVSVLHGRCTGWRPRNRNRSGHLGARCLRYARTVGADRKRYCRGCAGAHRPTHALTLASCRDIIEQHLQWGRWMLEDGRCRRRESTPDVVARHLSQCGLPSDQASVDSVVRQWRRAALWSIHRGREAVAAATYWLSRINPVRVADTRTLTTPHRARGNG